MQFDPAAGMTSAAQAARADCSYACRVIPFPATHRSVLERIRSARRRTSGARRLATWPAGTGGRAITTCACTGTCRPKRPRTPCRRSSPTAFEKNYVERYDPAKAKFRTFLRTCLDRFVQNQQKADRAEKRGGGATLLSLDFPGAERELAPIRRSRGQATPIGSSTTRRSARSSRAPSTRCGRACDAKGKRGRLRGVRAPRSAAVAGRRPTPRVARDARAQRHASHQLSARRPAAVSRAGARRPARDLPAPTRSSAPRRATCSASRSDP